MRERCRFNQKIYKRGQWYCFRIVDSFGNRPEIKSATKQEAQMKLLDMTKQVISGMSGSSSYTVTLEQAFEFWLKLKSGSIDESSYQRYQNHSKNFMAFIRESGIRSFGISLRYGQSILTSLWILDCRKGGRQRQ